MYILLQINIVWLFCFSQRFFDCFSRFKFNHFKEIIHTMFVQIQLFKQNASILEYILHKVLTSSGIQWEQKTFSIMSHKHFLFFFSDANGVRIKCKLSKKKTLPIFTWISKVTKYEDMLLRKIYKKYWNF